VLALPSRPVGGGPGAGGGVATTVWAFSTSSWYGVYAADPIIARKFEKPDTLFRRSWKIAKIGGGWQGLLPRLRRRVSSAAKARRVGRILQTSEHLCVIIKKAIDFSMILVYNGALA
jgi:hypothetical protein